MIYWWLSNWWFIDDSLMIHWWLSNWWFIDDLLMIHWWFIDYSLMIYWWLSNWWFIDDSLMIYWWFIGVLLMIDIDHNSPEFFSFAMLCSRPDADPPWQREHLDFFSPREARPRLVRQTKVDLPTNAHTEGGSLGRKTKAFSAPESATTYLSQLCWSGFTRAGDVWNIELASGKQLIYING